MICDLPIRLTHYKNTVFAFYIFLKDFAGNDS